MSPAPSPWEPVVGLEVHVELATDSKMFCRCRNDPFESPPNSAVCSTCLGLPGALPVLNRRAVSLGIRAALALGCEVGALCAFERKSYAYPDLVKGYQLTQYAHPVGRRGRLTFTAADGAERTVAVRRVHLEEDTAKLIHGVDEEGRDHSWLDANRSGVPLLEVVTEPEIHTAEDADAFLRELRNLLIYNGIAHCRMERGEMRLEANVSLRRRGDPGLGTRVEIKNQSSFRFVRDAIEYEVGRQAAVLQGGGAVLRATRGYNPDTRTTFEQRTKEEEQDYRYFPDPDLPPVAVPEEWLARERAEMPGDLAAFRRRVLAAGVREEQLAAVLAEGEAGFLRDAGESYPPGLAEAAKWLVRDLFALARQRGRSVGDSRLRPHDLAAVVRMVDEGGLTARAVPRVLEALFDEGGVPAEVVDRLGVAPIRDPTSLRVAVDEVLTARSDLVAQYRAGRQQVARALFGAVMSLLEGRARPQDVNRLLHERLDAG